MGTDPTHLVPIHTAFNSANQNIGMIIYFKKSAFLAPTSKIKFFGDSQGSKLLFEISAGTDAKRLIPPILFNSSKVWIYYDKGTHAILPKDLQTKEKSSLNCLITLIPIEWTTCIWMAENVTNAVINTIEKDQIQTGIDIIGSYIRTITDF